jgi:hypothetical protein
MFTNYNIKSNTVQKKQNCTPNSFKKLPTVLLVDIHDRLQSQLKLINEELERRGVEVESEVLLESRNKNLLTNTSSPSGWLDPYTTTRSGKEHPECLVKRDRLNPKHWYWRYRWRDSKGRQRSKYVAQTKVDAVRKAIATNSTPSEIIKLIKGGQVDA